MAKARSQEAAHKENGGGAAMEKAAADVLAAGKAPGKPGNPNINQIREILFGQFQRETEGRFGRLHERVDKSVDEVVERIKLAEERFTKALEVSTTNLEAQLKSVEEQTRNELDASTKSTGSELAALRHELDTAIRKLSESKTSRQDLGDYLMEVGMRLKKDPALDALQSSFAGVDDEADPEASALSVLAGMIEEQSDEDA